MDSGDFFDDFQRSCDPKMNDHLRLGGGKKELTELGGDGKKESMELGESKDATATATNVKLVEEKVIEYHSACMQEFYEHEDDSFFDEYQKELDSKSKGVEYKVEDTMDTMEYDSDPEYQNWW